MRTIEFRGKRADNGEWVYGYVDATMCKDIVVIHTETGTFGVNTETVGQFTGLHDKNGNEIYEGDIIQGEYNHRHLIRYTEDDACFTATLVEYVGDKYAERWNTGGVTQRWIDEFGKVVIGNIHDNPKLLKGGEK